MTTYDSQGLHVGAGPTMRTYTGKKIDPFNIKPEDVEPRDILHSLAFQCRYNGHSKSYLSVARHSVHVADWLELHGHEGDMLLAGLLHDAAEAYIGDLIRPLKHRPEFQFFRELDEYVTAVIFARFDVRHSDGSLMRVLPPEVEEADTCITMTEINYLRHKDNGGSWNPWADKTEFQTYLRRWRPEDFR